MGRGGGWRGRRGCLIGRRMVRFFVSPFSFSFLSRARTDSELLVDSLAHLLAPRQTPAVPLHYRRRLGFDGEPLVEHEIEWALRHPDARAEAAPKGLEDETAYGDLERMGVRFASFLFCFASSADVENSRAAARTGATDVPVRRRLWSPFFSTISRLRRSSDRTRLLGWVRRLPRRVSFRPASPPSAATASSTTS